MLQYDDDLLDNSYRKDIIYDQTPLNSYLNELHYYFTKRKLASVLKSVRWSLYLQKIKNVDQNYWKIFRRTRPAVEKKLKILFSTDLPKQPRYCVGDK